MPEGIFLNVIFCQEQWHLTSFLRETSACFFLGGDVCELSGQWVLCLVAPGLKSCGDKGILHLEGKPVECGLEKRGQCGQTPPWELYRFVSVFVALLVVAHSKIQIRAFQSVGLGTKRNDILLVSRVEASKPTVGKNKTWACFRVCTLEASCHFLLDFPSSSMWELHVSQELFLHSSERRKTLL